MNFNLGDKFFLVYILLLVDSYKPTRIESLILMGVAFTFAIVWEYFADLSFFEMIEDKINRVKSFAYLTRGYDND